jgi:hypothetical protein
VACCSLTLCWSDSCNLYLPGTSNARLSTPMDSWMFAAEGTPGSSTRTTRAYRTVRTSSAHQVTPMCTCYQPFDSALHSAVREQLQAGFRPCQWYNGTRYTGFAATTMRQAGCAESKCSFCFTQLPEAQSLAHRQWRAALLHLLAAPRHVCVPLVCCCTAELCRCLPKHCPGRHARAPPPGMQGSAPLVAHRCHVMLGRCPAATSNRRDVDRMAPNACKGTTHW